MNIFAIMHIFIWQWKPTIYPVLVYTSIEIAVLTRMNAIHWMKKNHGIWHKATFKNEHHIFRI